MDFKVVFILLCIPCVVYSFDGLGGGGICGYTQLKSPDILREFPDNGCVIGTGETIYVSGYMHTKGSQFFIGFILGQGVGNGGGLFNFGKTTKCPTNFMKLKGCSHCYHFSTVERSWHEARIECHKLGGHLVIVNSAKENTCIKTQLMASGGTNEYWMGLNDIDTEGTFEWDTKFKGNTKGTTFRDFQAAPGNGNTADCVYFNDATSFQWAVADCNDATRRYVCERSAGVRFKCNSW